MTRFFSPSCFLLLLSAHGPAAVPQQDSGDLIDKFFVTGIQLAGGLKAARQLTRDVPR